MQIEPAGNYFGYVVMAVVLAIVLFVRLRTMRRAQRLRLERLWIVPALYALITATILSQSTLAIVDWLALGVALLLGAAIGWRRGKLMRIGIDPATHELNQQASPAAMLFILLLIVIRAGLRMEAAQRGLNGAFLTDLLVVSALGLLTATRAEMFLRAKHMLAGVREAARPLPPDGPSPP